jgi:hypothetical protein
MDKTCKDCRWCQWVAQTCPRDESFGLCRISPPIYDGFPKVKLKWDWCGKFEEREVEEVKG